jgi:WhiB family redox-sensing transcriptional regulator
MSGALCTQVDPEFWFPEKGESGREAKAVCARCEVRAECLSHALSHAELLGVWGGTSERARRRMRLAGQGQAAGTPDRGAA